jgi:hypothetical protein
LLHEPQPAAADRDAVGLRARVPGRWLSSTP